MGADQSSLQIPEEHLLECQHPILSSYRFDSSSFPGSGRLTRTYRLRHRQTESTAVLKGAWVHDKEPLEEIQQELARIRQAVRALSHVATMRAWFVGESRNLRGQLVRPVWLLRPHVYTTLSDRLASRPWLQTVEKVWMAKQILQAVQDLHDAGVVHGFLTTENVGLTSTGWVVLLDVASYKARTSMPDDDPSEYLYYFHNHQHEKSKEKRCYLAPERFSSTPQSTSGKLTPEMDIFSLGCVLTELFLNGERCFDLGECLAYRKAEKITPTLSQKLYKIESSAWRAACKHMLQLDPSERQSARAYLDRLENADQFPKPLEALTELVEQCTVKALSPDARLVLAIEAYRSVLWETMGVEDAEGEAYFSKLSTIDAPTESTAATSSPDEPPPLDPLAEAEALISQIESMQLDDAGSTGVRNGEAASMPSSSRTEDRSEACKSSLLVYLQLILVSMRHTLRPMSKLVALRIVARLVPFSSDDARLQRIVPVTVSLLQDQDPVVRATALGVLSLTLEQIRSFSPTDSQLFPQYIFKKLVMLVSDSSLLVRVCFAHWIGSLAESSFRFLNISHAVRIYEAVGSGTPTPTAEKQSATDPAIFAEDVADLLGPNASEDGGDVASRDGSSNAVERTLISSTYASELRNLRDIVSRWIVFIATDQSEHASFPKRAMLRNLGVICTFFGVEGVMAYILPQILAFLNDRRDWELRASLFSHLAFACPVIGPAATEEFVLPCVEIGLVDSVELVVERAMHCLSGLIDLGLLSQRAILGSENGRESLVVSYGALLVHPYPPIRRSAIQVVCSALVLLEGLDATVFLIPKLAPFLRFQPRLRQLVGPSDFERCLHRPLSRRQYGLERGVSDLSTTPDWTAVESMEELTNRQPQSSGPGEIEIGDALRQRVVAYTSLLSNGLAESGQDHARVDLVVDLSMKSLQRVLFPRNDTHFPESSLPDWFDDIRKEARSVEAVSSVQSISSLGQVFGLSIMAPTDDTSGGIVDAGAESSPISGVEEGFLESKLARILDLAMKGSWLASSRISPETVDSSLLVSKLCALSVPPLPLPLGRADAQSRALLGRGVRDSQAVEWRPRFNTMVATSAPSTSANASVSRIAVSGDNRFFATGGHDGMCRVWSVPDIDSSVGTLESVLTYDGHSVDRTVRVNDLAMVEGTHSIVSASSDGCVHVWRVDSSVGTGTANPGQRSRVNGTSGIKKMHPNEGEILAVSQFNLTAESVVVYSSQQGSIHSWDLRCAAEPFSLRHGPELGVHTALAVGPDRHWILSGTSRGHVALWDVRFHRPAKLWKHSHDTSVTRLATSTAPSHRAGPHEMKPAIFVAAGPGECGMYDAVTGLCTMCFRTTDEEYSTATSPNSMPTLVDSHMKFDDGILRTACVPPVNRLPSRSMVNCFVGSIGPVDKSYVLTGSSDGYIGFWDFTSSSRCFVLNGNPVGASRPVFERAEFENTSVLLSCRLERREAKNAFPRHCTSGLKKPDLGHTDSVNDLKMIDQGLVSCSRDSTVKVWR